MVDWQALMEGRVDGSSLSVGADGRIRKMWVRGPFLRGLPFTAEADIERLLGPAAGLERSYGSVIYHYPERSFSVSWYARENRLESVALGAVDWSPLFGARRVLEEWLAAGESWRSCARSGWALHGTSPLGSS